MSANVVNLIMWTCAIVFILTAAITLLSVINVIKIDHKFREKLFYALLIEVVVGSVTVFKTNISTNYLNLVRITAPSESGLVPLKQGVPLFVFGVCSKEPGSIVEGAIKMKGQTYRLSGFCIGNSDNFSSSAIPGNDVIPSTPIKIIVRITKNGKVIVSDSTTTNIIISNPVTNQVAQ
jgi:hypothetical protein